MASVYLACPTTRDFPAQYVSSLYATQFPGPQMWEPVIGMAIDQGRNIICERFLARGYGFLLMHDSDATWAPGAVRRLAERNLPVVTGVIFKRDYPTIPTIGKRTSTSPEGRHMYSFGNTMNRIRRRFEAIPEKNELVMAQGDDDIEEIDGCGSHFMMVRRDVIEKIRAPWFECTTVSGGEDFDFCRKVQAAGFKLYVDYSVWTGHVAGPGLEIGVKQFLHFGNNQVPTVWTV